MARGFIRGLGDRLSKWSERFMPDPFIFALVLTAIACALGSITRPRIRRRRPVKMIRTNQLGNLVRARRNTNFLLSLILCSFR